MHPPVCTPILDAPTYMDPLDAPPMDAAQMAAPPPPPMHPRGQTNTCKNVTFPQLRLQAVKIVHVLDLVKNYQESY